MKNISIKMWQRLWILTVFIVLILNVNTYAELNAIAKVHHKNDTLTFKLTFFNQIPNPNPKPNEVIWNYIGLSDFAFAQSKTGNFFERYLPSNYGFTTTIYCWPKKYDFFYGPIMDRDPYSFELKYMPKLVLIEKNVSVVVVIKQYCPKSNFQENEQYQCSISVPYLDDSYALFLEEHSKINEEAEELYESYDKIIIDISEMKHRDYKRNYSKLKISKCDRKILITAFIDHILRINADVIFE